MSKGSNLLRTAKSVAHTNVDKLAMRRRRGNIVMKRGKREPL